MIAILLILALICIVLLIKLCKNRYILIIILGSFLIIEIVMNPKLCINSALDGALIFFNKVFPSLFPFIVISNIILAYDGVEVYSNIFGRAICKFIKLPLQCSFVVIISLLCGYPLGAKYTCELYEKGIIDFKTSERLLNIASNGSPLFIVGSVGALMLDNTNLGYYLLLSNSLSCVVMAFILPAKNNSSSLLKREATKKNLNIGYVFKNSIDDSIKNCVSVGGFIVIFSVLNSLIVNNFIFTSLSNTLAAIFKVTPTFINGVILGIIEMTNGCNIISISSAPLLYKLLIISFLITFSGLSIISQTFTFTYKFNFSTKKYIFRKFLQGLISSGITFFMYSFFISKNYTVAFNSLTFKANNHINILIFTLFLLILPSLLVRIKKLFKLL